MNYVNQQDYLANMQTVGVVAEDDFSELKFLDEDSVLGFDFTNLTIPEQSQVATPGVPDTDGGKIERQMLATLFQVFDELDSYPLSLYLAGNEWTGEDENQLHQRGLIGKNERDALALVRQADKLRAVISIDKNESEFAISLLLPQLTLFDGTASITNEAGDLLAVVSRDDEISFNTTNRALYDHAHNLIVERRARLPFDLIIVQKDDSIES